MHNFTAANMRLIQAVQVIFQSGRSRIFGFKFLGVGRYLKCSACINLRSVIGYHNRHSTKNISYDKQGTNNQGRGKRFLF